MAKIKNDTQVITNEVRFSYLHAFEPQSFNGSDPKYSVSLIIPKSDTSTLKCIKQAVDNAKNAGVGKFGGKIPANLKLPVRDGDVDRADDENYAGCYFINANAKTKPGLIYKNGDEILDETDLYSGCYGLASISFYAFNSNGNRGIACGLNNLMKTKDGDPLGGGRAKAEDDFAEFLAEDNEENMEDLF